MAEHSTYLVLFFWGAFSDAANRALRELREFAREYTDVPVCSIDVQQVKGVHKEFGVGSVPTVLVMKNGGEAGRFVGVESAAFYATQLAGMAPTHLARRARKKSLRVTVYTSPGCPPCGLVKAYLREHGISFRSVDISRDERAAREIARRSGQQAVPQIDINGRIVVGFDRGKLASLLGIRPGKERAEP
jgi:glutaredoxin-like YruB-family protein